jgi:membrane protein DedA with SNARE-associated domain
MSKPLMLLIWAGWSVGVAINTWIGRSDWHIAIAQMWGALSFLTTIYIALWTIKKKKENEKENNDE